MSTQSAQPTLRELAGQALSSTAEGYDKLAPKFDASVFRTPESVLAEVAGIVGEMEGGRALDLCCGTGAAMEMLDSLGMEHLVGVDISEGMLAQAHKSLGELLSTEFELKQGDVRKLTFEREFDLAVMFGATGHIRRRDQRVFLKGVYRALKPGGRFFFVTSPEPTWWSPRRWMAWAFNQSIRIRNRVKKPAFHMYYLLLPVERAKHLLGDQGFEVAIHAPFEGPRLSTLRLVEGRRPEWA